MAQRRMYSPEIVGSDAFIEMSLSAQLLYFHLGMRADDDGFVNPNITMRMIGANADDLRLLLVKRFLLQFENGVVVVKHWRVNNFIRKDRYRSTTYLDEKRMLRVKENMAYTFDEKQGNPIHLVPWKSDEQARLEAGQPNDIPQVNAGEDRIGKDRIGKDIYRHISFLKKLPQEDMNVLSEKYKISPKGIQEKATDLLLYCEQKGRVYKNYKSFLENAVRKDKLKLQNEYPFSAPLKVKEIEAPPTEEQQERIKKLKEATAQIARGKKM